jgi:hypothetical protein
VWPPTRKRLAKLAANAGIDMDMTGAVFSKYLKQSVEEEKCLKRPSTMLCAVTWR